jgi:hypothetical protein
LVNAANEQIFINLISHNLVKAGCKTIHARGDADVLIVDTAVIYSINKTMVLEGQDTDLTVVHCHHTLQNSFDIYLRPEQKFNARRKAKLWSIKETKKVIRIHASNNILFAHAILGCDTISGWYGIVKATAFKKLQQSSHFLKQGEVFNNEKSTQEQIVEAGEQAFVCLYNGQPEQSFDELRLQQFCD